MKNIFVILLSMILLTNLVNAQDTPSKFGKISDEELNAKVCPIDSNAHAYYIFDCGQLVFTYPQTISRSDDQTSNGGFVIEFERHFRIKILSETAYDLANIEIPLYVSGSEEEKLLDIDAISVNFENGKALKTKFEKRNIVYETNSKFLKIAKVPIPNVKVGSIIDVKYSVKSHFFYNLKSWRFQRSIPVLYSNYVTRIPEYYSYHKNVKGYFPIKVESKTERNKIVLTYKEKKDYQGGSSQSNYTTYTSTIEYFDNVDVFIGINIPSFEDDEYLRSASNYNSEVEFELASTKFPNSIVKSFSTTWENVVKELLDEEEFGVKLKRNDFFDTYVKSISLDSMSKFNLMQLAFDQIKNKIKWNESNGIYVNESLKKSYNEGIGSSADINLCLVGLLEKFGFETYPVVLSTQANGFINLTHPTVSDFNYVIAMVRLDGKDYFMDATEPFSRINLLPIRCLNDKGLIVKKGPVEWVDLMKSNSYKNQTTMAYSIDKDFNIQASLTERMDGYAAYLSRKAVKKHSSVEDFVEEFQKNIPGFQINSYQFSGIDSLEKPLIYKYEFSLSNSVESTGNLMFVTPLLFETQKKSPFKMVKRDYPVEYNYPSNQFYSVQIEIPENYSVETLPQSINISMPDKQTKFTYNLNIVGNKIIITSIFVNNRLQFLPTEYNDLKEFYRVMIEKQNEKIVLKQK